MSWTKPTTAIDQISETDGVDTSGAAQHVFAFKAPYGDLETAKDALKQGDPIVTDKWIAKSWDLARIPGGWGELKITCTPPDPQKEDPESGEKETLPLEDLYKLTSCRNDVSIFAYCGPSPEGNPYRPFIDLWLKETDPALIEGFQYRDAKRQVQDLPSKSKALAKKILAGVQSVMRFYPMLTRTRVYSGQPPKCLENLGFIDAPPKPGDAAKRPGGVDAAIDAHQWLKCKDDVDQRPDAKWTRTEAWIGIKKTDSQSDSPWDEDLYGASRWKMPYQ